MTHRELFVKQLLSFTKSCFHSSVARECLQDCAHCAAQSFNYTRRRNKHMRSITCRSFCSECTLVYCNLLNGDLYKLTLWRCRIAHVYDFVKSFLNCYTLSLLFSKEISPQHEMCKIGAVMLMARKHI